MCAWYTNKGVGRGHVGGENICTSVRVKLFWWTIYCAKSRPNPESQSGSRSLMVLARQAPWIIQDYNHATIIEIQLLTCPRMCEMGYSIFPTTSQLKVVSITWDSLPSTPFTETLQITNEKIIRKFPHSIITFKTKKDVQHKNVDMSWDYSMFTHNLTVYDLY